MHQLVSDGFAFIELTETAFLEKHPNRDEMPDVPFIWQCPADLPAEQPYSHIQTAVLAAWREQLAAAAGFGAALMVVQFRRPKHVADKTALIDHYTALLQPITADARAANVQLVLRNSPDNRDQLQLLREIVRQVPGLGIALDIAYAHHDVVKNLTGEYLWDSDLAPRLAHVYASDATGRDYNLRLPLGSVNGIDWARLVSLLRERYNASVTIDVGDAALEYLKLSREKWLSWWAGD